MAIQTLLFPWKETICNGVDHVFFHKILYSFSDSYGVSEGSEKLGVEVKYMGEPFTQILKDPYQRVITLRANQRAQG